MHLFRGAVDPEFIFIDYNERTLRALMVYKYLESEIIQRMTGPADSLTGTL